MIVNLYYLLQLLGWVPQKCLKICHLSDLMNIPRPLLWQLKDLSPLFHKITKHMEGSKNSKITWLQCKTVFWLYLKTFLLRDRNFRLENEIGFPLKKTFQRLESLFPRRLTSNDVNFLLHIFAYQWTADFIQEWENFGSCRWENIDWLFGVLRFIGSISE